MKQHPVWNALSHATVIGSAMFIIFICIDRGNPAMDFLGSNLSKWCLLLYCIASMITALCSAVTLFKRGNAAAKKHPAHRQPPAPHYERGEGSAPQRAHAPERTAQYAAPAYDPRYAAFVHARETYQDARYADER